MVMFSLNKDVRSARVLLALFALGSAACGGGGDGPMFTVPDSAVQDGGVGGYWVGQFVSSAEPGQQPIVVAMTTEQGDAQLSFPFAAQAHVAGAISSSPENASGNMDCYLGSEIPFVGTEGIEPMILVGEITPKEVWKGSYKSEGDEGGFNLGYSATYEYPSSIDRVAGIYQFTAASSGGAAYSLTLEVNQSGAMFGQDTTGCVYAGTIGIIDGRYNMYRVLMPVQLCGEMSGQYMGLASMQPGMSGELTTLVIAATSGEKALALRMSSGW